MNYRTMLMSVVLGITVASTTLPATASNKPEDYAQLMDTTQVAIAEEKTAEAHCQIAINGGLQHPCAPGSVVWTRITTYAEIKKTGIIDFVVLGSDTKRNDELINKLANTVSTRVHQAKNGLGTQGACLNQPNRTIDGSYRFSTGKTMYYTLSYATNTDCKVFLVNDRTKTDGSNLTWFSSCTDAESATNKKCAIQNMGVNGTWTTYYFKEDSFIGRKYQHNGKDGLHSAFGWYYFD